MITQILDDFFSSQQTSAKDSPHHSEFDYGEELRKRRVATENWKLLSPAERKSFGGRIDAYFKADSSLDFKTPQMQQAKNLHLLKEEMTARMSDTAFLQLLQVEELGFSSALIELLENTENTEHVKELYRLRKRTLGKSKNAGIDGSEAQKIRNCLRQGRELYLAGLTGSLMVKPLNFFYSLSAYAYAIIILNNPIRYSLQSLPGSHGLNYLPDDIRSQFGGDIKQGTFSELFASFASLKIRNKDVNIMQDNLESIRAFYTNKITASSGTLLSMIPEVRDYYHMVTGRPSRTHPLLVVTSNDIKGMQWEFQIGDGTERPSPSDIDQSFASFQRRERNGKTVISVPFTEAHKANATIFSDIRGRLWYVENPFFPVVLPEICVHFLLTNAFSNIMRYAPDDWGEVLSNEVHSDVSLITRKYLSAFEQKAPALLLRSISKFHPYVAAGVDREI